MGRSRFRRIIRIPGKTFNDLSLAEVASMIEADSSMSPEGNEQFDSSALDVFLHNANLSRCDLLTVREELLAMIYVSIPGSDCREVDVEFLRHYSARLRERLRDDADATS